MIPAALPAFVSGALGALGLGLLSRPRPRQRSLGLVRALAKVGVRVRPPADLELRLAAAGRPGGLGTSQLMAAKTAAGLAAGGAGVALSAAAPGRLGLVLVLACPVAGFLGPDLWLRRLAAARARRVRRDLPLLLDLLRVQTEAGASLPAALREVGRRAAGPLAVEWAAVAREVEVGVPLGRALAGMELRLPLPEVRALVAALERSRRHGSPVGDTLAAQAREARFALARRIREEAARAGPKIQLVVALLLVPSVLLLVAAALAAALLSGGDSPLPS
ncbi:MAG TPA: type II secretion system F family protein [Thermoleophilaceae bacterium]